MDIPQDLVYRHADNSVPQARMNIGGKLSTLNQLKNVLSSHGQLQRWKNGPFGHLVELKAAEQILCGRLILSLLARELFHAGARPDEMWFGIGGRAVRFGREEFALVTGLRFGVMRPTMMQVRHVLNRHFGGKRPDAKGVLAKLVDDEWDGDGTDVLRLCYVYTAFVMTGREQTDLVPEFFWSMVEDVDAFESFPWGTYIYSMTMWSLRTVIDRSRPQRVSRVGVRVHGFLFALQWWALEAFPGLEGVVGKRRGRVEMRRPRCLNWVCSKKPQHVDKKLYDQVNGLRTLEPTEAESSTVYYASLDPDLVVDPDMHRLFDGGAQRPREETEGGEERVEVVAAGAQSSEEDEARSKSANDRPAAQRTDPSLAGIQMVLRRMTKMEGEMRRGFRGTEERLSRLSGTVEQLAGRVLRLEERDGGRMDDDAGTYDDYRAPSPTAEPSDREGGDGVTGDGGVGVSGEGDVQPMSDREDPGVWAIVPYAAPVKPNATDKGTQEEMVEEPIGTGQEEMAEEPIGTGQAEQLPHETAPTSQQGAPQHVPIACRRHHRRARKAGKDLRTPFTSYPAKKKQKVGPHDRYEDYVASLDMLHRSCGHLELLTPEFLRHVLDTGREFEATHIDAYICALERRREREAGAFDDKYTVIPTELAESMSRVWTRVRKSPDAQDVTRWATIVDGDRGRGEPWWLVENVLLPVNISNLHWIMCKLDLKASTVIIYDSLSTDIHRERVASVQHLRDYLPVVLRRSRYFDRVQGQPDRDRKWKVAVLPGVPQQQDATSCGAFVCRFISYALRFRDGAWDFDGGSAAGTREMVARELFESSDPVATID